MTRKRDIVRGLTASDCVGALATRYESKAFALIEQVANGTGMRANRWADVIAMSLWPSRGLTVHGFEIKISRGDWQRELAKPEKSSEIQAYCDEWWIVAPDGLIEPHELPPTWGLLGVTAQKKAVVRVPAPKLDAKPLDRPFVAAVLRRASDAMSGVIRREREAGREDGAKNGAGEIAGRLDTLQAHHDALLEKVGAFEKASGLMIQYGWDGEKIGRAVEIVLRSGRDLGNDLRCQAERYRHIAGGLEKDAAELDRGTKKPEAAE